MAIKDNRPALERHIRKALESLVKRDIEDALYQIAPALDVTAKKRYKELRRVGERIKAFIFEEQSLIYYLSSQGRMELPTGVRVVVVDMDNANKPVGNHPEHGGDLADFIYHNIRCAQSHDAEVDYSFIDLGREFGIGRLIFQNDGGPLEPKLFVISTATVLALILSVICAPENRRLRLAGDIVLYNKITLEKDHLVGNKDYLVDRLQLLFNEKTT